MANGWWMGALVVLLGCSSPASAPPAVTPAAATLNQGPLPPATKKRAPKADSFWLHMIREETVWVLQPLYTPKGQTPDRIEVEIRNRRLRDGVVIVDLDWSHIDGKTGQRKPLSDDARIVRMAANGSAALWKKPYDKPFDDASLIAELKASPTYDEDPPQAQHTEKADSSYNVEVSGLAPNRTACFEDGPGSESGDCSDVCFSAICVSERRGIVSITGNYMGNDYQALPE